MEFVFKPSGLCHDTTAPREVHISIVFFFFLHTEQQFCFYLSKSTSFDMHTHCCVQVHCICTELAFLKCNFINFYYGIEFFLVFFVYLVIKDGRYTCKFRNARSAFRNSNECPLSSAHDEKKV